MATKKEKQERCRISAFTLTDEVLDKLEFISNNDKFRYNKSYCIRQLINEMYAKITKKEEQDVKC